MYRGYVLYTISFVFLLFLAMSSVHILTGISHIYQHGYRAWDIDYAGLGEEGFVYKKSEDRGETCRILYRSEACPEAILRLLPQIDSHVQKEGRAVEFLHLSRTTYVSHIEGKPYIIKLSRTKSLFETLFFTCRHSRSAWNNAELAKRAGLATIEPIALVEIGSKFQLTSYLIYPLAGKTLAEKKGMESWVEPFKRVLAKQRDLSIIHPDFRPKNVIQLEDSSIQYIDIDDLHRYPPFSYVCRARFNKELKRFENKTEEAFPVPL